MLPQRNPFQPNVSVTARCGLHTRVTAPIASGWSDCRVDFHPLEAPPLHGAPPKPDIGLLEALSWKPFLDKLTLS